MQRTIKKLWKRTAKLPKKKTQQEKNVTTEVDKVKIITQNSTDFFFLNSVKQLEF